MIIRLSSLFLLVFVALAGCETMQGAGQDIESAGEVVQDGAQQVQKQLN